MLYLCRYGELGLKSPAVRKRFLGRMKRHLESLFLHAGESLLIAEERGRLYVEAEDSPVVRGLLSRVFGMVSFSPVIAAGSDLDEISSVCMNIAKGCKFSSFGVRCRRTGSHPYTSQEAAAFIGERVGRAFPGASVDLGNPDLAVHVEIRNNRSYIYTDTVAGPGGLPLGSQGLVIGVVERERDVLAMWMMLRRGCHVTVLCKDGETVGALKMWDPEIRVKTGDFSDAEVLGVLEETGALGVVKGAWEPKPYTRFGPHPVYAPAAFLERDIAERALDSVLRGEVPVFR